MSPRTRILIAEDDLGAADDLVRRLTALDYQVCSIVASGEDAVTETEKTKPDIIILDIILAGSMDGIAAAQRISSSRSDLPILFLTSYADDRTIGRARLAGARCLMMKPAHPEELRANIELALAQPAMMSSNATGAPPRRGVVDTDWLALLKAAGYGVILANQEDRVNFMNAEAETLTGWKSELACGRSLADVFLVDSPRPTGDSPITPLQPRRFNLVRLDLSRVPIEYRLVPFGHNDEGGVAAVFRSVEHQVGLQEALQASRRKYKELIDTVDGIVWEADIEQTRFMFVSKQAEAILGYPVLAWLEPHFFEHIIHNEDLDYLCRTQSEGVLTGKGYTAEYRLLSCTGQVVWVKDSVTVIHKDDKPQKLRGIMIDITQRKAAEHELFESEQRYRTLVDAAPDLIFSLSGGDARFLTINQAFRNITGWDTDEWVGKPFAGVVAEDDVNTALETYRSVLSGDTVRGLEISLRTASGEQRIGEMTCKPMIVDSKVPTVFGIVRDVTERKRTEQQLVRSAFYDALTGLPNRALFMERLSQAIMRCKRTSENFAVLFIDLDRFKVINDSLGHSHGDSLLIQAAERLRTCLRPNDVVGRLGGDEFVVLLNDVPDVNLAVLVADRIQKSILLPFRLQGQEVFTSASIGIAMGTPCYDRGEEILRDADIAMYRAKFLGRARYQLFDASMRRHAMQLLELETDLRRAVERNEFHVVYQPIFELKGERISSFEALVRWDHPERGTTMPGDFMSIAEETGLIMPLGRWILESVCKQMAEWRAVLGPDFPLTLSVNISGKQFSQPDFLDEVKEILEETGACPLDLNFEITESALIENPLMAEDTVQKLRELGIRLHLDDFGTGYSSLGYLHRFPVDTIKIDKFFIETMDRPENKELVRTILVLAQNLGKDAVAEGIETPDQLRQLEQMGCRYGQGFLLAQPLEVPEAFELIKDACVHTA